MPAADPTPTPSLSPYLASKKLSVDSVEIFAGSGRGFSADGLGLDASFVGVGGISITPTGFVVTDFECNTVRLLGTDGAVTTLAGDTQCLSGFVNAVGTSAMFSEPRTAVFVSGIIYVADTGNNCIRSINAATGAVDTVTKNTTMGFSQGSPFETLFRHPWGIASFGTLYVADYMNSAIIEVSSTTG
jgi:hypothetical protein